MTDRPRFLTDLDLRQIGPDRFRLLADLIFYSAHFRGQVIVRAGFETDLASVPKIVASLVPKYGGFNAAAVIHDAALEHRCVADDGRRQNWTRGFANDLFAEGLAACGVSWWRRQLMIAAVRAFATRDPLDLPPAGV